MKKLNGNNNIINNNIINNIKENNKSKDLLKEKTKNKSNKKQFIPPTLEEIKQYIKDKGFNINAKSFYEYYSSNDWKDKNNNPVKNWKLKMITWNRNDNIDLKDNNNNNLNESLEEKEKISYKAVDTSRLSAEEYGKLLRKEITIDELIKEGKVSFIE